MTLDDVVPHPQYRMCHARSISAPPTAVWDELGRVTMSALPLGYALESIRLLPAWLAGRRHQPLAERTFLDVTPIPVLFCRPPQVVISAGLSQAWRLLGGPAPPRLDAAALRAWSQPGWIKVAMEFRVEPTAAGTRLSTETRVTATDPRTRRLFAAYWFFIRPGSSAIRREVLRVVGDRASRRSQHRQARRAPQIDERQAGKPVRAHGASHFDGVKEFRALHPIDVAPPKMGCSVRRPYCHGLSMCRHDDGDRTALRIRAMRSRLPRRPLRHFVEIALTDIHEGADHVGSSCTAAFLPGPARHGRRGRHHAVAGNDGSAE